jgi:hypothetical protein
MGQLLFLAASFYGRRDVRSGFERRLWPYQGLTIMRCSLICKISRSSS